MRKIIGIVTAGIIMVFLLSSLASAGNIVFANAKDRSDPQTKWSGIEITVKGNYTIINVTKSATSSCDFMQIFNSAGEPIPGANGTFTQRGATTAPLTVPLDINTSDSTIYVTCGDDNHAAHTLHYSDHGSANPDSQPELTRIGHVTFNYDTNVKATGNDDEYNINEIGLDNQSGASIPDDIINLSETMPLNLSEQQQEAIQLNLTVNSSANFNCTSYVDGKLNKTTLHLAGTNVFVNHTENYFYGEHYYHFFCNTNESSNETTSNLSFVRGKSVRFKSYGLDQNNSILNFSIQIDGTLLNTTTGQINTILIPSNYSINWTNNQTYFNVSNISVEATTETDNISVIGLFNFNFTMRASHTNGLINPNCTLNTTGYSRNSNVFMFNIYNLDLDLNTMTCELFGFRNKTLHLNDETPNSTNFTMDPAQLVLYFSQATNGTIVWNEGGVNFSGTSFIIEQDNISIGYVQVIFNDNKQVFSYYNDNNTHITQNLTIIEPDLAKPVKVTSDGSFLVGASVSAYALDNNTWKLVFSQFTDEEGEAIMLLDDTNIYKFIAQKDGYVPTEVVVYVEPSNVETLIIELDATSSSGNQHIFKNTCGNVVTEPSNCTIGIVTWRASNSIVFNVTQYGTTTEYTSSDSNSYELTVPIYNGSMNFTTRIWIDDTLERTYNITYEDYTTRDVQITFNKTNIDLTNTNKMMFALLITITTVIIGVWTENKWKGWGILGSAVFLGLMGTYYWIFWVPATLVGIYLIIRTIAGKFTK